MQLSYFFVKFNGLKMWCICVMFTNLLQKKTLTFHKNMDIIDTKWLQIYCINISIVVN